MQENLVGFVCFGEVNTPIQRLHMKHDEALAALQENFNGIVDGGLVIDDPAYEAADAAYARLASLDLACLIVCVAGWIPTHAVIRVTDRFRHVPMLLWGLCGWKEDGCIITTADQAGTTAARSAFEAMDYTFKYLFNIIGKPWLMDRIEAFVSACRARKKLRCARVGTMGYRDMMLYGTQFEGNSMRGKIGVEVESYEMLEMVRTIDTLDPQEIADGVAFVRKNWIFKKECPDITIEKGVKYALAIVKKIEERGWEAITLLDVNGMKKLEGFPPAMVFMLLEHYSNIPTIPENDVLGAVTQLIMKYISGQTVPYLEYYEFFENSVLIGVPDFIPKAATKGDVEVLPAAFGQLNTSLLNVSRVKTGYVTCARLVYLNGKYRMHVYTGEAKAPPVWNEYGWDAPAPQLPSLEVFIDSCTVEQFAQNVSSQHVIVAYGDYKEAISDFCEIMDIELVL